MTTGSGRMGADCYTFVWAPLSILGLLDRDG